MIRIQAVSLKDCRFSRLFMFLEKIGICFYGENFSVERTKRKAAERRISSEMRIRAEKVLQLYGNSILRLAYSYFYNMSDAEDILQETLIRYMQAEIIFSDQIKEKAWLLKVAANLVLMVGAGLYMFKMPAHGRAPVQMEEAIPDIKEVSSVREMSELLGFTVPEPTMPFDVETTTYLVNWGELGEIDYEGKDQSAYFRISREEGDNSGDYNEYENITTEKINSMSVTLKGNQDSWKLAIWQDGEYSCSLGFSEGITVQQMRDIVEKIKCR